jgi:hypothetical protein
MIIDANATTHHLKVYDLAGGFFFVNPVFVTPMIFHGNRKQLLS